MDWVHCNTCGSRPKQIKMFVTSCGHLICEGCLKKVIENKCLVCKKEFRAEEVCAKMRADLLDLFRDPKELAGSLLKELSMTVSFQNTQRKIVAQIRRSKMATEIERLKKKKAEEDKVRQEFEVLKKEYTDAHASLKIMQTKEKELIEKLKNVRKLKLSLENRQVITKRSRTEPPSMKNARYQPPEKETPGNLTFFGNGKSEAPSLDIFFDGLSASMDEAPSRVTSTPISNIKASRKEFMKRMFSSGADPSPIFSK